MYLVTGATGNVGAELVHALIVTGHRVRALTRRADPATVPSGAEAVTGDLDRPETVAPALSGVDGVFLLAGYADMPGLLAAIRAAGVRRVVLLSSGAVPGGDPHNAIVRYNAASEAAVRAAGVSWTILRPSGFMSNTVQWVPQLRDGDVVREPFADVAIAAIDPYDIAAVAALALTENGHDAAHYRLTGPAPLRSTDRLRILADVLGRELRLEPLPDAEARTRMSATMPADYVDAFFSFFADGTYDDSLVHHTVEHLTGRSPRTFRHWAQAHAEEFR